LLTASEAARHILAANSRGEEIVSVVVVDGPDAGARLLVPARGPVIGALGASCNNEAARYLAEQVLRSREPVLEGNLFAELHAPAESLIVFGAGHIAVPLAELGVNLGFAVTVLDDRDEFASTDRFPAPARVQTLDLADPLNGLRIDENTYVVLVTRAHKHDFDCLRIMLSCDPQPRYIGMIGSRRRVRAAFTALLEGGVAREALARVRAPVGLDINAETPYEIAVSIAAEIVAVRRGGGSGALTAEERVLERFF
jgi:xanthine dehydrogenase accessory factor